MTTRKVVDLKRRETRQRRGGGHVRNASDLPAPGAEEFDLTQVLGDEPPPEFAALMVEERNDSAAASNSLACVRAILTAKFISLATDLHAERGKR